MKSQAGLKWMLLLVLALIWGSSFILMKKGLVYYTPSQVAAIRMLVACMATFPFVARKISHIKKENVRDIAIVGVMGSGIPAILFTTAQQHISSSLAGMLNSLTPVFTLIIGYLFYKSKFTVVQVAGVVIGLTGACGLILLNTNGGISANAGFASLIVIATVCYGVSVNTIKSKLNHVDSFIISGLALFIVAVPYSIYLFSTDFTERLASANGGWAGLGYVATLAVFGTAASNILFYRLVKISSPLFASTVTYLIPLVALLWGLADGEGLHILHLLALTAILGGVALTNYRKKAAI